jgi:hypothetical protein
VAARERCFCFLFIIVKQSGKIFSAAVSRRADLNLEKSTVHFVARVRNKNFSEAT